MKTLKFHGYSDDTFGEYGVFMDDHDNCGSGRPIFYRVKDTNGEELVVFGQYAPHRFATWVVGVMQVDDGGDEKPIPDWPMRLTQSDCSYSPCLEIDVPDSVTIEYLASNGWPNKNAAGSAP